ncbi:MAG: glycosyltransferase family 2 protein [bacterium]
MSGISAIIHTYNSEKYLEECLQSVSSVDEIIICDMYSTDRTIKIAEKFGCKIIYHENIGFADPARNFAISHAANEWILVVDSDEIIPKELLEYLREMIKRQDCPDVFFIPRKNILLGKFLLSWYPNSILRFFRKDSVSFSPHVHCIPEIYGKIHKINPKQTQLAIIHYNYDSIESFISRMNKYTTLELEKFKIRKTKFSIILAVLRAFGEFLKRYFLKGGFKDGQHGFIFAVLMAFYKFIALIKLWEADCIFPQEHFLSK